MEILEYYDTVNPEWWLKKLGQCDWVAGQYLHRLLTENRFREQYGESAKVLLQADGSKLVSFCTYAEKDEIPDTGRRPWLGFVYTHPDYRGRRLTGRLICRAKLLAREDGSDTLWISTGETGLYEKYGAVFDCVMKNENGKDTRVYRMDTYGFYGWQGADVKARMTDYPGIETPRDLYDALWHVWSRETCAPRMREDWDECNPTLGQCSITAFLAQDIFGGLIYGVPLEDGNFHCYNVIGDCVFDLTSEQFGGKKLNYNRYPEQLRHTHFQKQEKRERYEALKAALKAYTEGGQEKPGQKNKKEKQEHADQ